MQSVPPTSAPKQMLALVKAGASTAETVLRTEPVPAPAAGEVLLRVRGCGLCGSDVHAWRGDTGYEWVKTPVILGHEIVGEIAEVGDGVDSSLIGRLAVPISIDGCAECSTCASGHRQLCSQRSVLGLSFDGGIAEFLTIEAERLAFVPRGVSTQVAALTEPLAVAIHAVNLLGDLPADAVVGVSGPGPVGLLAAWALAQRGVEVFITGIDRDESVRLPLARTLGLRAYSSNPPQASHWVEASGSGAALNGALQALAPGAVIVVVALYGSLPQLDINLLVRGEQRLIGSYAAVARDYESALELLVNGAELSALVSEYRLEDALTALHATAAGEVGKAVVCP